MADRLIASDVMAQTNMSQRPYIHTEEKNRLELHAHVLIGCGNLHLQWKGCEEQWAPGDGGD